MRLVLVTNIWNHYMGDLAVALARTFGHDQFRMVLCEPVHEERRLLGWKTVLPDYEWLVPPPSSSSQACEVKRLVCSADIAILGDSPSWLQHARVSTGKLTFFAMERLWKTPLRRWRYLNPRFLIGIHRFSQMVNHSNVHYLAIGRYAPADARTIGVFGERIWTWGYFVDTPMVTPSRESHNCLHILWAGRMIGWKRADLLIRAASLLRSQMDFRLDMVGAGPERHRLGQLTRSLGIEPSVTFCGPLPPDEVRALMGRSDVCVLSSDRNEGWGVVANEAMGEGSILVANEEAGAAQMLIEDGAPGFLFPDGNYEKLAGILLDVQRMESRRSLSEDAVQWVRRTWHPSIAADRFALLAQAIECGSVPPSYASGPCRHA